jgi:flavin-dependent thymidylate synthase
MKVTLLKATSDALEVLLFTKSTRLKMSGTSLDDIKAWPIEKKMKEWEYMQNTIKSSWEFIDYIFVIEDVSRAFTQQLERHRIGTGFAEQSLRTIDASDFDFVYPPSMEHMEHPSTFIFWQTMEKIKNGYATMIDMGTAPQDARGVLPLNIAVNIAFKANLRSLNAMSAERLCVKAQGEFQQVMREIRKQVISVHPWTEPALRVSCAQTGVCAFPSYPWKDCPIKGGIFNPETGLRYDEDWRPPSPLTKIQIQKAWEDMPVTEAKPKEMK